MLPLGHTYISMNVTGRKDALLLFGSVLPDIAATSKGNLSRDEIHDSPQKFYAFVEGNYPEYKDLALGSMLHVGVGKGADFYTDDFETGFAYVNGKHLNVKVADLLQIEPNEVSRVPSHNFIEGALDYLLATTSPEIVTNYKESQEAIKPEDVSSVLAEYLQYSKTEVGKELESFKRIFDYRYLTTKEGLTDGIVIPLIKLRMNKDVDREKVMGILDEAVELIEGKYMDFLEHTVREMKVTFESYL